MKNRSNTFVAIALLAVAAAVLYSALRPSPVSCFGMMQPEPTSGTVLIVVDCK